MLSYIIGVCEGLKNCYFFLVVFVLSLKEALCKVLIKKRSKRQGLQLPSLLP